ncbi:unnamed protein product [Paramecium octaurelia]|uniref:Uncharacterized protein n=1 Tax=Paramecium octaurelia TaxID=43137 RepID=A0A8S1VPH8_PAROT|nr:unnamed protein product [Paramecium octaurelia]
MDSTNVQDISLDYLSDISVEKDRGIFQTVYDQHEFDNLNEDFKTLRLDYKIIINQLVQFSKKTVKKLRYLCIQQSINMLSTQKKLLTFLLFFNEGILKNFRQSKQMPFNFCRQMQYQSLWIQFKDYKTKSEKNRQTQISQKQQDILLFQKIILLYIISYREINIQSQELGFQYRRSCQCKRLIGSLIKYIQDLLTTFLNMHKILESKSKWFLKGTQLQLDKFCGKKCSLSVFTRRF